MTPAPEAPGVEPKKPFWKNPFVIAFVVGAVMLTFLPFAQRRFLKAPPPGPSLGKWELQTLEGQRFGSEQLAGKVWLASFATDAEQQAQVGGILRHVEDLGGKVVLVSFVFPGARVPARPPGTEQRWVALTGTKEQLQSLVMDHFRPAFVAFPPLQVAGVDAGSTMEEFVAVGELGLVDQDGALRGFWPQTELGRGNAINAARLLARYGPRP